MQYCSDIVLFGGLQCTQWCIVYNVYSVPKAGQISTQSWGCCIRFHSHHSGGKWGMAGWAHQKLPIWPNNNWKTCEAIQFIFMSNPSINTELRIWAALMCSKSSMFLNDTCEWGRGDIEMGLGCCQGEASISDDPQWQGRTCNGTPHGAGYDLYGAIGAALISAQG